MASNAGVSARRGGNAAHEDGYKNENPNMWDSVVYRCVHGVVRGSMCVQLGRGLATPTKTS